MYHDTAVCIYNAKACLITTYINKSITYSDSDS